MKDYFRKFNNVDIRICFDVSSDDETLMVNVTLNIIKVNFLSIPKNKSNVRPVTEIIKHTDAFYT